MIFTIADLVPTSWIVIAQARPPQSDPVTLWELGAAEGALIRAARVNSTAMRWHLRKEELSMPIRLDGFYVSKQPVDFGMPETDQPYSYLRFYNDGTVIQSDIPGIPPAATPDSFDRSNCGNKGQYQTDGHNLRCVFPISAESSGSGKASTIEEEGEIVGDELHVHHVSYINNFSYDEQYKFYAWF